MMSSNRVFRRIGSIAGVNSPWRGSPFALRCEGPIAIRLSRSVGSVAGYGVFSAGGAEAAGAGADAPLAGAAAGAEVAVAVSSFFSTFAVFMSPSM